jgi:hypothetical protein
MKRTLICNKRITAIDLRLVRNVLFSSYCTNGTLVCTGDKCTPNECEDDEFQCVGDYKCIPGRFQCDGMKDCVDHSDEKNCSK